MSFDFDDQDDGPDYESLFKKIVNNYNRTGQKEFCGLSPIQMRKILYYNKFVDLKPFLDFNKDVSEELLMQIPVMKLEKELIHLMQQNDDKIYLTNQGNLKLKFTKKIFNDCKFLNENGEYDYFIEENTILEAKKTYHIFIG